MEAIWKAYPVLDKAQMEAKELDEGEADTGREMIRAAVVKERTRLRGKRKPAATEIGRALQNQADAAAAVADQIVNDVAEKILDEMPPGGRKQ